MYRRWRYKTRVPLRAFQIPAAVRCLLRAFAQRRHPRFVPPVAVRTAGPAPGMPHPCGCRCLLRAFAQRRHPRFIPPVAVQTAGPAPGMPHPRGCFAAFFGRSPKEDTHASYRRWRYKPRAPLRACHTPAAVSLPSSGVRPKKTPTLRTAGGGTNRGPRSGHATPPRLSPRPLDSRGLALGCTAGASGRLPSMELLSMELLGNDCCFLLRLAEGNGGSRPFCLPPLAGEGARRADGGSAGMRGGSRPHPALRAPFSRRREKGGWAICICPAYGSDAWARPGVSCLIVPPRSTGVSKSPAASRPGRCRSGRSAVRG
ncbi:hypothetical protein FHT15_002000 [Xanthomonas campestris]